MRYVLGWPLALLSACSILGCSLNLSVSGGNQSSSPSGPSLPPAPPLSLSVSEKLDAGEVVPVAITGGTPPYQWSVSGPGTFNSSQMHFSTSWILGPFTTVLTAVDSLGRSISRSIRVRTLNRKYDASDVLDPSYRLNISDISVSPSGLIYVSAYISNGNVWLVYKSSDGGLTFSLVDEFTLNSGAESSAYTILAVTDQIVLVAGEGDDDGMERNSVIRRTSDGGLSWTNIYTTTPGSDNSAKDLVKLSTGEILVLVSGYNQTSILRSMDQGLTWTSVYSSAETGVRLHLADDQQTLYLGSNSGDNARIRRSTNAGTSWTQIDNYAGPTRPTSVADISARGSTICWVGRDGNMAFAGANMHWLSRCSTNGGSSWTTGERFRSGGNCWAYSVGINQSGDIHVLGYTPSGQYWRRSQDGGATWVYRAHTGWTPGALRSEGSDFLMILGASTLSTGILKTSDGGESWTNWWQTPVQVPQYSSGTAFSQTSSGDLFAVGSLNNRWTILKSSTGYPSTWATSEAYLPSSGGSSGVDVLTHSSGRIFAAGSFTPTMSSARWTIRASQDSGGSWTTADEFQCTAGRFASPWSMAEGPDGSIYVVGYCLDGVASFHWGVIRKSSDLGATWSTVDTFVLASGKTTNFRSVQVLNSGEILVGGHGIDAADKAFWILRRSSDQGATWTTVESALESGPSGISEPLLMASSGATLWVSARAKVAGVDHLLIRQSIDKGLTWSTVRAVPGDSDWQSPYPTSLSTSPDGIYLGWYQWKIDWTEERWTLEKSREGFQWFELLKDSKRWVGPIKPCGTEMCGIGYADVRFKRPVWSFFRLE